MSIFLDVVLAILIVVGFLAAQLIGVAAALTLLKRIGLNEEDQAQVMEEAAVRLASERVWFP